MVLEYLDRMSLTVVAEDSVLYESPYWGQHGVSFLVEAYYHNIRKNTLVDVGQNHEALLHNMKEMNISPEIIDSIVLTHCHYDHTFGVVEMLRAIGKEDLPVIAHPSIFRLNFIDNPYLRHVGVMQVDSRDQIEANGGTLYLTDDPFQLMPGLITTGEVKRQTDFEEVGIALKTINEEGKIIVDSMDDDISLVANFKDKGIVIITGCSHAGIVNIVKQAVEISEKENIESIIGGFHLVEAPLDRIKKTVEALSEFDINTIFAGHCTGFRAQAEIYHIFKDKFLPLQTGMKFEF
ncbi:MAG TPA: MBL fold metallo-hydrolase [Atribacterota bacterium]|nr:MBL fold metallo-hydrolase [Atribacterota bacterium]